METTPQTVRETVARLRRKAPLPQERRLTALHELWRRLPERQPSETGRFPWAQVRRGVGALARSAPHCLVPLVVENSGVLALILAGNTPLLAWPVLHYCVLLGIPVFIKQSRDEALWTRHFVETLASVDEDVAASLHLDLFPGDSPQTEALVQCADAVIAYGSDSSIASLRVLTPESTPFQGFGHAVSITLWPSGGQTLARWLAQDVLAYDQGGCLSPQVVFVEKRPLFLRGVVAAICRGLMEVSQEWDLRARTDLAECRVVREARELALMEGCDVFGDDGLRWTLIVHPKPCVLPFPVGFSVLHLIPLDELALFGTFLGAARGRLSSVGVAGAFTDVLRVAMAAEGVSRICPVGQMQTPPLDWKNGGVDLRRWLAQCIFRGMVGFKGGGGESFS